MIKKLLSTFALLLALPAITLAANTPGPTGGHTATAVFAGGSFWCSESDFEKVPGVFGAESGYTNGHKANPTYEDVSAGGTRHTEAVRVTYAPTKIT